MAARVCLECGEPFAATRADAEFCCKACRQTFGNRRLQRGAELYDLFMLQRFERPEATRIGAWSLMCRAASQWRSEDQARREGRRSWTGAAKLLDRLAHLHAVVVHRARR